MKTMKNSILCLIIILLTTALILPASAQNDGWNTALSNVEGGGTYYAVSFVTDSGSYLTALVNGGGLTLPEDPHKEGYKFLRWECEGQTVTDGMTVDHDLTINAVFEPIILVDTEISYVYSNNGSENVFSTHSATLTLEDSPYTVVSPEYTEVGEVKFWPDRKSVTISADDLKAAASAGNSLHITVNYNPADLRYTLVKYVTAPDGKSDVEIEGTDLSGHMGAEVTAPAETAFGTLIRVENKELTQSGQIVNAFYQRKHVHLTFDTNGGEALPGPDVLYGQTVELEDYKPTRKGYRFTSWLDENSSPVTTVTLTEDRILSAQWEAVESAYSVVYYKEMFSGSDTVYEYAETDQMTGKTGTTVTVDDFVLTKNYKGYEPDETMNAASSVMINGEGTAVLPVYYKLSSFEFSFNLGADDAVIKMNGQELKTYSFTARLGEPITSKWPTEVTRPHYYFNGWDNYLTKRITVTEDMLENRSYTARWTTDSATKTVNYWLENPEGEYTLSKELSQTVYTSGTLNAKTLTDYDHNTGNDSFADNTYNFYYDRKTYVIEYYNGAEKLSTSDPIRFGAAISPDFSVENSDRTLIGWFTDAGASAPATMPNHNLALYARWEDPQVTFVTDDSTQTISVPYGTAVAQPDDPVKAFHSFTGWYTEGGDHWNFGAPVTEDVTLYACFSANALTYRVEYLAAETGAVLHAGKTVTASGAEVGDIVTERAVIIVDWLAEQAQSSLTLSQDPDENVLTITYTKAPQTISYTVHYLRADDSTPVREPVTRTVSGDKAVVYEFAAEVPGLFPTRNVESAVLTAGTNEITFYYRDYKTAALTVRMLDMDGDPLPGHEEETYDLRLAESFDGHVEVPGYTWDHAAGISVFTATADQIGKSAEMELYYRKNLTLRPADLSKVYDGEALVVEGTKNVIADGLMEGHRIESVVFSGSQMEVGESASTIESVTISGPKSGNAYYAISFEEGTLTVTEAAVEPTAEPTPTVTKRSVSKFRGAPVLLTTAEEESTPEPTPAPTPVPLTAGEAHNIEGCDFKLSFTGPVTYHPDDMSYWDKNGTYQLAVFHGAEIDENGKIITPAYLEIKSGNVTVTNNDSGIASSQQIVINGNANVTLGDLNLSTSPDPDKPSIKITGGDVTLKTEGELKYGVVAAGDSKVTLAGVNISPEGSFPAMKVNPDVECTMTLAEGSVNTLQGGNKRAGLEVGFEFNTADPVHSSLATLILDGEGTLNAYGGERSAGIGGSRTNNFITIVNNEETINDDDSGNNSVFYGHIIINGGTINAQGGDGAAGIGSSDRGGKSNDSFKLKSSDGTDISYWGGITINDGTINATGQGDGSGIGGGSHCDSGKIIINGGTIFAESTNDGSGIGAGLGSSKTAVVNGEQKKGPGYYYADVTINGGDITAQSLNYNGAGIGGGMYSDAIITINGGKINATGGAGLDNYHHGGAGIGGGYQGHAQITINGGEITAQGGMVAAGIGSGGTPNKNTSNKSGNEYKCRLGEPTLAETTVTITGGTIKLAQGGERGGAGIGGGAGADQVTVNITGGTILKAIGGFSDSTHMLGGAGIGGGVDQTQILSSGLGEKQNYFQGTIINISIEVDEEDNKIVAIGGWGASGIGSGAEITGSHIATDRTNIKILSPDANIEAYADGTKFAIDTRLLQDDGTTLSKEQEVAGNVLQGTFVHAYTLDTGVDQDPEGLSTIKIFDALTGKLVADLTGMAEYNLEHYRSFATSVPAAGEYLVFTDAEEIGAEEAKGRYFALSTYDIYNANALANNIRYMVNTGTLSDNFYLYPVKSILVRKTVTAPEGLNLKGLDQDVTFILKTWASDHSGSEVQRATIEIRDGVPQNMAAFSNITDNKYEIWEEPGEGSEISGSFGTMVLKKINGESSSGDNNNGTISEERWHDTVTFENVYELIPDPIDIPVEKVWEDENDQDGIRPTSITLQLYANGAISGSPVSITGSGNTWSYTFKGLPQVTAGGSPINYTVEELDVPQEYTSEISGDMTLYTITNSYTPEVTEAIILKVWEDNDDEAGARPESIEVQLLANGSEVQTVTLSEENHWTDIVSSLPKYAQGEEIAYTWSEPELPEGYELTSTDRQGTLTTLTNSYTVTPTPETPTPITETPTPTTETPTPTPVTPTPEPPDETEEPDEPEETVTPIIIVTTPAVTPTTVTPSATPSVTLTTTPAVTRTPLPTLTLMPTKEPERTPQRTPEPREIEPVPTDLPDPEYPDLVFVDPGTFIDEYGVPLGLGQINLNAADCFE